MSYIERVPKHVSKDQLPGLKVGSLVKTLYVDYSQDEKHLTIKPLPAGTVGRLKSIYDFGARGRGHRFYCEIKFEGHPLTCFYSEELARVCV